MSVTTVSLLPLNQIRRGDVAVVEEIVSGGQEQARLASMGLTVGSVVEMLMPGKPCAVAVGGSRLVLRCEQVQALRVSLL